MTQTAEQKETLAAAKAAAPGDETLRDIAARVPPLARDAEHSFVPADETDRPEGKEVTEPLEDEGTLTITRPDRAESTYERSSRLSEVDLERMSDEQIKDAGVLSKATPRIAPSRLAPSSDRPRQPGSKAPAAGAGSWPVHEGQMPAVMPTDPPVKDPDDRDGDVTFAKAAGFSSNKDGTLTRKGVKIEKNEVAQAAALFLRLRQQFPSFTKTQLADEFEVQWLSGRAGASQSHRAGEELSENGLTAAGDDRVVEPSLGQARAKDDAAFEADPSQPLPAPADMPEAGLPSENEPASTAPDAAKKSSGETAKADAKAIEQTKELKDEGDDAAA